MAMRKRDLERLVKKWQLILRLEDWDVDIDFGSIIETEGNAAICEWVINEKAAKVRVLRLRDWPKDFIGTRDYEITVVHELEHLHAARFDRYRAGSPRDVALELMIQRNAEALVALDRKAGKQ